MLNIDGSFGEGGGQIIRSSVTLSALTGKPVHIVNVRAKRSRPGLQPQHLAAVQAAGQICGATIEGGTVGSTEFTFKPSTPPCSGSYFFDIGTAGSAALVLQTVLLPLVLSGAPSRVRVIGGTYNPHAPSADYIQRVFLPVVERMGVRASLEIQQAGYYPKGGGEIECVIEPAASLTPIDLVERGPVEQVDGYVVTSSLPPHVAERGAAVVSAFASTAGLEIDVEQLDMPSRGTGAAVLLTVACSSGRAGFLSIGERGKPMERVTSEACEACAAWLESGTAVDEYLADQLVLPAVLAKGRSAWSVPFVTEHLRTVIWLAQHFVDVAVVVENGLVRVGQP